MRNQFTATEQAIEDLRLWIIEQKLGENGRHLNGMFEDLDEQLTRIRTDFNDIVHDDITERVFDAIELGKDVTDADLAHTASKFLVEPDMSDRQTVIDQLRAYVGIAGPRDTAARPATKSVSVYLPTRSDNPLRLVI